MMQRSLSDFAREARARLGVGPQYVFPTTTAGSARTASRASSRREPRQPHFPTFPLLPPEEGAFEAATGQNGLDGEDWPAIFAKMKQRDELMILRYDSDITSTLTMAGFLSVVVTFFLIEAYTWLQPTSTDVTNQLLSQLLLHTTDANADTIAATVNLASTNGTDLTHHARHINILWGISLVLSLATVLNGLLVKQWLREYINWTVLPPDATSVLVRQLRAEGFSAWKMELIIRTLSTVLQLSIIFLAAGLLELFWAVNKTVFVVLAVFIGFIGLLLLAATLSPLLFISSPFKSQLAWSFAKIFLFAKYLLSAGGTRYRDWTMGKYATDIPTYSPTTPDEKKGAAMKAATTSWAERDRAICSLPLVGPEEFNRRRLSIRALSWVYRTFPEDDVVDSVHSRAAELIRGGDVSGFLGIIAKGLDYPDLHTLGAALVQHDLEDQPFAPTHYRSMAPERRLRELELLLDVAEVQLSDEMKYREDQFQLTVDLAEQLLFRYTPRAHHVDMRYLRVCLRWLQMVTAEDAVRRPRPLQKVERACMEGFMGFTATDMDGFLGYVADKRATDGNPFHSSPYEFIVLASCALYALSSNLQTLEDPQVPRQLDLLFMLIQVHLETCNRTQVDFGGLQHGPYPERYSMPISPLRMHHAQVEIERRLCWPMFIIACHRRSAIPSRLVHTLRIVCQWDRHPAPPNGKAELPIIAQHNPYVWQLLQKSTAKAHPLSLLETAYADMLVKWDIVKDIGEKGSGTPSDEEFLGLLRQANNLYNADSSPEERRPFVSASGRVLFCASRNLRLATRSPQTQTELQLMIHLMAGHLDSAVHLAETSQPLADNLDRVMMARWIHPVLQLAAHNLALVPLELLEALGLGKACGFLNWGSRPPSAEGRENGAPNGGGDGGQQSQQQQQVDPSPGTNQASTSTDELLGRYLTLARAAAVGQIAQAQQQHQQQMQERPQRQTPSPRMSSRPLSEPQPEREPIRPRGNSTKQEQRGRNSQPRSLR